jgi:hypothetical protein
MPCQITNVACVPNGMVTGWVKFSSPIVKNRAAAAIPAQGRPDTRQPTTAVSTIPKAHKAGTANRSDTAARSTPATMFAIAMCA